MERRGGGCSPPAGSRRREEPEFNLREWGVKAKIISRENTNSRRYSASFIRSSFKEDPNKSSFRSNFTISSTASSPGYSQRDEIDPSTYSFTTALQALQARSAYNCWESLSPEGFALNSKWSEAEKYICNPLSGEFPMECLSAKTLSGRSGRMITMSAPLIFSSSRPFHPHRLPLQEVKTMRKRDAGTQSKSPPELSSEGSRSSPAASTPPILERKRNGDYSPPSSSSNNPKLSSPQQLEVDGKDTREEKCYDDGENEEEKAKENGIRIGNENEKDECNKKQKQRRGSGGGCLSWMSKKQRDRESHKPRKTFCLLPSLKGC